MKNKDLMSLNAWNIKNNCEVNRADETSQGLIKVKFLFNDIYYNLYIDDEYNDFNEENQLLCLYLVLRTLRDYKEEDDFLNWCDLYSLNASDSSWLTYYKTLGSIVQDIESETGKIDIFIPDLDYQLRSSAFSELVRLKN